MTEVTCIDCYDEENHQGTPMKDIGVVNQDFTGFTSVLSVLGFETHLFQCPKCKTISIHNISTTK